MKGSIFLSSTILTSLLLLALPGQAATLIDGTYYSADGENGRGGCKLVLVSMQEKSKYGDQLYAMESSGEGSCEWSAIGLSKNFSITAGLMARGGVPAFVKLTFPFGPAGKRIELTSYDADGTARNKETFAQRDEMAQAGK